MSKIMTMDLITKYPHISFRKDWKLTPYSLRLLGECNGLVKAICNTPILPDYRKKLMQTALIKGAQATTAIEGNTLTESEIEKVSQGKELPPSKEYQKIEVKNILNAFAMLFKEVVFDDQSKLISPELIKHFHFIIGQNLGEHLDAEPGRFRQDNRTVGTYRCPDYQDVEELMDNFCKWLKEEFNYVSGIQKYYEIIVQAIVSHIYLEWIHPFGDGNGRTGRLLEFYILLRGKTPDIALHILSNHYNLTRPEYYRQIQNATLQRNLSQFIEYALVGFRDGLQNTLDLIHDSNIETTWKRHVYDTFEEYTGSNEQAMKRKRRLVLDLEPTKLYSVKEIVLASPKIAKDYATIEERTVYRDLEELEKLKLLTKDKNGKFKLNIDILVKLLAIKKE